MRKGDFPFAVVAFILMAGAILWLNSHGVALCPFHAITTLPCPFCGGTRAIVALLSGEPVRALAYNPLVCIGALLFPVCVLQRPLGPSLRTCISRWGTKTLIVVVMSNWVYLLCVGR